MILVFGRIARSCCSMSLVSTNVVSMPIFGSHCDKEFCHAAINIALRHDMIACLHQRQDRGSDCRHARGKKQAASVPSSSAIAFSATVFVGFP